MVACSECPVCTKNELYLLKINPNCLPQADAMGIFIVLMMTVIKLYFYGNNVGGYTV